MVATCQAIVTRALQISKSPGFQSQAGQTLNDILSDLSQTYDFDAARGTITFPFNLALDSGPHPLPADYLRAENEDVFYTFDGVKYILINVSLAEFDGMIQQPGLANFPTYYTTDMSLTPPGLFVWMPPSIPFAVTIRYRRQMPDIVTPETSAVVPWFPNSTYLVTRLAGEMCKITGDERWKQLLDDAESSLRRYLQSEGDRTARATSVQLDRRRFGANKWNSLPTSKLTGY